MLNSLRPLKQKIETSILKLEQHIPIDRLDHEETLDALQSIIHLSKRDKQKDDTPLNLLYVDESCGWPGCKASEDKYDEYDAFCIMHLNVEHILSERTLHDLEKQRRKKKSAEISYLKEKDLYEQMQKHLNSSQVGQGIENSQGDFTSPILDASNVSAKLGSDGSSFKSPEKNVINKKESKVTRLNNANLPYSGMIFCI